MAKHVAIAPRIAHAERLLDSREGADAVAFRYCRVTVLESGEKYRFGCGFVIDGERVVTCRHVVRKINGGNEAVPGFELAISHEGGAAIPMALERFAGDGLDACVLRRTDGGAFRPDQTALWAEGQSGTKFSGLGMSKDYSQIGLNGELVVEASGGRSWIVQANTRDGKIEPGCSGAGVFDKDGALLGMVATYQQEQSGQIIQADVLDREFGLKRQTPLPSEPIGFAPGAARCPLPTRRPARLPVAQLIRNVDRNPQRNAFLPKLDCLESPGFLIVEMPAAAGHLPEQCVEALRIPAYVKYAPAAGASGKGKVLPREVIFLDDLDTADAGQLLSLRLQEPLGAKSGRLHDLREAYLRHTAPLAIVVTMTADQLDRLPPEVARAWADQLDAISAPKKKKPLLLFVVVLSETGTRDGFVASSLAANWALRLAPLDKINAAHVSAWCRNEVRDPAVASQINAIVAANAAGLDFTLQTLQSWLEQGG